ncbi:Deoxycytidine monophosphate (dCMP) deaminase [Coniothyrium glycines]
MLIGLCGGICAGKSSIASYLVDEHAFARLRLARPATTSPASASTVPPSTAEPPTDNAALHTFPSVDALLDFVTLRWRDRWVTTDIWDNDAVSSLLRRPFFLLVSVDAPVTLRWSRYTARCAATATATATTTATATAPLAPPSLADFVLRNDAHLFAQGTGLSTLIQRAQLRLLNSTDSLPALRTALRNLNLTDEARLRPSWDQYFMQLADLAAHRSNCMKRRVGCCIVRGARVISTGYNGTPRGMTNCNAGGCPRCNSATQGGVGLSTCLCLHAEENALLEAGRDRIGENAVLYCNTCPCLTCSVKITQVGISEVVYNQGYLVDDQTARIFKESGVRLRQFTPPTDGLVDLSVGIAQGESEVVDDIRNVLGDEDFLRPL